MKKKIILIVSSVAVVIGAVIFIGLSQQSEFSNTIKKGNVGEWLMLKETEVSTDAEVVEEVIDDDSDKEETVNIQNGNDGQSNNNNNQNQGNNNNGNNGNNDNSNNNPEPNNDTPKTEDDPKVNEPQDDDEYNRLIAGTFPTNESCTAKGLEVALSDTVNVAGSSCETVAYKGKIIGYKLYIRYSDGEYKYYPNK